MQTGQKRREETDLQQQDDEKVLEDIEILSHPSETEEKDENMADENEDYVILPGKKDFNCECTK